jgi:hypothetical protein
LRLKVAGPHGSVVKLQIFLQIFQPPFAAVGKRRRNGVPMMQRRSFLALGGVSILAFGATGVRAQTTPAHARASSPGGVLTVEAVTDNDGRPM